MIIRTILSHYHNIKIKYESQLHQVLEALQSNQMQFDPPNIFFLF